MFENRVRNRQLFFYSNPGSSYTVSLSRSRTGTGVADWKNKLKRCIDASSPYTLLESRLTDLSGGLWSSRAKIWAFPLGTPGNFVLFEYTGNGSGVIGSPGISGINPASLVPADTLNQARRVFVQKCLNEQRLFQGATVLGELHKTIESIRHPLSALRNGISGYFNLVKERGAKAAKSMRGLRGSAGTDARRRSVAKAVQGTYLEYVYGVLPTLQDMSDAVKAAAHLVDPDLPVRKRVSSGASFSYHVESLDSLNTSPSSVSDASGHVTSSVKSQRLCYASGRVHFTGALRCITPGADRVRLLGFAARDFVPTLWELLPYSFLVDYFVNVNDIFDALSFNVSDLAYSSYAIRSRLIETITSLPQELLIGDNIESSSLSNVASTYTVETTSYSRSPVGMWDLIPTVQLSVPSARQLVNIGALVGQHSSVVNYLSKLIK